MKNTENVWFPKEIQEQIEIFKTQKEQEMFNFHANGAKNEEEFATLHKLNEILKQLFELYEGSNFKYEGVQNDFTIQLNGILHSWFEFKLKE